MNRRVDFVIGGTQKGGTTALWRYLREHPDICLSSKKEVHFFDRERYFKCDSADYSKYHRRFTRSGCADNRIWGDKTPIYMYWYSAPRRIWEYNPNMKWILLLRNPIERAYSHWHMTHRRGKLPGIDFMDAIQNERIRARESLPFQDNRHSFVDRGFYSDQLRRIWSYFPRQQTLIMKSEAFKTGPKEILQEVYRFLGAEVDVPVSLMPVQPPKYDGMKEAERQYLTQVYQNEVREVERLLGWDCSDWLS